MRELFKTKSWGFWIAVVSAVLTIAFQATKPPQGHFLSYFVPSISIWNGANPYGVSFPGAQGHFHYSPSSSLFFFSWFAFLPPLMGELLYLIAGLLFFTYALSRALQAVKKTIRFDVDKAPWRDLFWLMISSELVGSLLAIKVEITIAALVFLSLALLLEGKPSFKAGIALGLGIALNFQTLPVAGLMAIVLLSIDRDWKFPLAVATTAILVTMAAVPFLGIGFAREVFSTWISTTSSFTHQAWLSPIFQTLYRWIWVWFGTGPTLEQAYLIGAIAGALFTGRLARWAFGSVLSRTEKRAYGLVAAAGLGSGFCAVFYPLSQSNAYTIYTPLLLTVWIFGKFLPFKRRVLGPILVFCYCLISVFYSDLVPRPFYRWVYDHAFKPIGVLIILGMVLWAMVRSNSKARSVSPGWA